MRPWKVLESEILLGGRMTLEFMEFVTFPNGNRYAYAREVIEELKDCFVACFLEIFRVAHIPKFFFLSY